MSRYTLHIVTGLVLFTSPLLAAFEVNLTNFKPTAEDCRVNGRIFYRLKVDGKTACSDAIEFYPNGGFMYHETPESAGVPVFYRKEYDRFSLKTSTGERYLQLDNPREFRAIQELSRLAYERAPKDEHTLAALKHYFDFGSQEEDAPDGGGINMGLREQISLHESDARGVMSRPKRPAMSHEKKVADFIKNPSSWIADLKKPCTDEGCYYNKSGNSLKVWPKLKDFNPQLDPKKAEYPASIPVVTSASDVDAAFRTARSEGKKYFIVNSGRLDSCPGCIDLHANIEAMLKKRGDVAVVHVNRGTHHSLAQAYGFDDQGLPYTAVFDLSKPTVKSSKYNPSVPGISGFRLTRSVDQLSAMLPN